MKNEKEIMKRSKTIVIIYYLWMAVCVALKLTGVIDLSWIVVLLPMAIEGVVRVIVMPFGQIAYWKTRKRIDALNKDVWDIRDKSAYTEDGIKEIESIYEDLNDINNEIGTYKFSNLYNCINEHFDETFDIIEDITRTYRKRNGM